MSAAVSQKRVGQQAESFVQMKEEIDRRKALAAAAEFVDTAAAAVEAGHHQDVGAGIDVDMANAPDLLSDEWKRAVSQARVTAWLGTVGDGEDDGDTLVESVSSHRDFKAKRRFSSDSESNSDI